MYLHQILHFRSPKQAKTKNGMFETNPLTYENAYVKPQPNCTRLANDESSRSPIRACHLYVNQPFLFCRLKTLRKVNVSLNRSLRFQTYE